MEREYGATIDIAKSSTLSIPGTFNPLVIIKKLTFNHSTIESKDKEMKSPDRLSKNFSPKKSNFSILNNFNPNKNNKNSYFQSNKEESKNDSKPEFPENNNLLKSIRTNKSKRDKDKDKTDMQFIGKEANIMSSSFGKNIRSPIISSSKEDKKELNKEEYKSVNNIINNDDKEKIFEKKNILFTSLRREREGKTSSRRKSGKSKKNDNNKEKDNLDQSFHLETISEKGKKKKKKKDKEHYNSNNQGVILPIIINSTNNNKEANISTSYNNKNNEEDKNSKEKLRKNYSQSIAQFRKTSESVFNKKKSEQYNKESSNFDYINNNYTNRYTSVMKSYRDKKLHIFDKNKYFYYVIMPGNCSYLIKNCMQHRINWKECSSNVTTMYNFKWQQNNIGIDFASLSKISTLKQIVNHFEFHSEISNKCNLFLNMMKYCESRNIEVFKILPFTVLIQYDSPNYINQIDSFNQFYNNIKDHLLDSQSSDKLKKDPLSNLSSKEFKYKKYSTFFNIPGGNNEKLGGKTNIFIDQNMYDNKNFWIVKACNLNRGRCIKMADSLSRIQKLIKKFYEGIYKDFANDMDDIEYEPSKNKINSSDEDKKKTINKKYKSNFVIIQKYIEKPLLYRGRKFDIRIWVLMTHKFKVYIFREGHLKTSSVNYDINVRDSYVHITNYSIQKYNEEFSKHEYGNEVSFKDFQTFLDEAYPNERYDVQNNFVKRMKEIIDISAKAIKSKINANERTFSFEIFGYDFIMDSEFNIYLLEINTNPGLEESSPLIKILVPRMIDDALRLTIDDVCDTKYSFCQYLEENNNANNINQINTINIKDDFINVNTHTYDINNNSPNSTSHLNNTASLGFKEYNNNNKSSIYVSPFSVENYSDSENIWELVCDLNEKEKSEKPEKPEKPERLDRERRPKKTRAKIKNKEKSE